MKADSSEVVLPQFGYLMIVLLVAALGDITGREGVLPALAYMAIAFLPIYKVKPRNIFFKYGFIALAIVSWAICSVLIEGTIFDVRFSFFS